MTTLTEATPPSPRLEVPARPIELGFDLEQYPTWRDGQVDVVRRVLNWYQQDVTPFLFLEAPTGWGKSLIAGTIHRVLAQAVPNYRGIITTTTINLQKQYMDDTLVDLATSAWGRQNYECLITDAMVDEAPCTHGFHCPERGICDYYVDRDAAHFHPLSVLNTAFYMTAVNRAFLPRPFLRRDHRIGRNSTYFYDDSHLVIHDEAHLLEAAVRNMVEVKLSRPFFASINVELPRVSEYGTWEDFIETHYLRVKSLADSYQREAMRSAKSGSAQLPNDPVGKRAVRQLQQMEELSNVLPTRPIVEQDHFGASFRAVWGKHFAEPLLWSKAGRHILMSATLPHPDYVAETLGMPQGSYSVIQLPSPFAIMRRRILYKPAIKVTGKTTEAEFARLINQMDDLLDSHSEDKGIIHSVSYDRAAQILRLSRHRHRMVSHARGRESKEQAIERFLRSEPGAILVSPAVGVGEDFGRGENCRFQVFVKYPVPYLGDPVVRARAEDNPDSLWREADMAFVQAVGRGMRDARDFCTNYLLDSGAAWRFRFLPQYIRDSIITV